MRCVSVFFLLAILQFALASQNPGELFGLSRAAQDKGDFIQAEKFLLAILDQKESIRAKNIVAVYNQLGIINNLLGRYDKAIIYYLKGENIVINDLEILSYKLPSIYINLGNIYKHKGDYKNAIDYFQESVVILKRKEINKKWNKILLGDAYNNIGIVFYLQKDYLTAIDFYQKSVEIRIKNNFDGLSDVYSNYANCLRELNDFENAEDVYQKGIDLTKKIYGKDYYKLSYMYKAYGKLKIKKGAYLGGLALYNKALKNYIDNYGEKHPYTADMYEILGDFYFKQNNNEKALVYYQKSLIANSGNFNNNDIYENPEPGNIFSEIHLLRSLKKKAKTLLAVIADPINGKDKLQKLKLCTKTLELALKVIQNVRQEYLSIESKLYITQNEKEFYITAIESALQLYELTNNKMYIEKAYQFSRAGKAAVLLNEITQNEAFTHIIPDSLKKQKTELLQNIASISKLIFNEREKRKADSLKIERWQSELFKLNKKHELMLGTIKENYPAYSKLLTKTKLLHLSEIQTKLSANETLIEYSYLTNKKKGQLYTFVLNKEELRYYSIDIDSSLEHNIEFCRQKMDQSGQYASTLQEYNEYNQTLFSLYCILMGPLEINERKSIIIVPDEKIAYLSFDVLISDYKQETLINYVGLPYLGFNYQFSYAYSTNLLFKQKNITEQTSKVYAFAPSYHSNNQSKAQYSFADLKNAKAEIKSILKYFKGNAYIGDSATKSKFKAMLKHKGIYHLALHANSEKENPDYSFLAFSGNNKEKESKLMFNYEISSLQMNASLLVLSACNTGSGEIYSGEGVMSLSRGFILAGASSVVHSLWKINDESSSIIMGTFYKYLSKGKSKSEALQLAKIDYVKNSSPEMANPVYWAGIVLLGDKRPLVKKYDRLIWSFLLVLLVLGIAFVIKKKSFIGTKIK